MLDELFRYETNTKVRQILVSHNVDMTKINYSCIKKTIYVYGCLNKTTSEDFSLANIKSLVAELIKLPHVRDVQFDLDNWFISTETGELNIVKGKKQIVCNVSKDDQLKL
jgi:hypothetical protein